MGLIISKTKNLLNSIFSSNSKIEDSPAYLHMTKMLASLKYPKQRQRFYQNPKAKHTLTELIKHAIQFKNKSCELLFKDYLTELEMIEKEIKERPFKLLKAMVDAKYGQANLIPFSEDNSKILTHNIHAVPAHHIEESPAPEHDIVAKVEYYFDSQVDIEMDLLCEQLNTMSLEQEDEDYLQQPKRLKTSDSNTRNVPSMNMVESLLSYAIWHAKSEIIAMQNAIKADVSSTQVSEHKRAHY